ncbi:hypothetical protein HanXRQr2_Chr10g0465901 [Helianthus annuus]|uniref:Uncharacterized protein n=1 Tax=Helianthus annuus TaxID=4232 RepID=A0A251TQE3_HELAN|nr:hypothetical protein HanXRQr2_Chr10g0465901 [Helianthus annuus]
MLSFVERSRVWLPIQLAIDHFISQRLDFDFPSHLCIPSMYLKKSFEGNSRSKRGNLEVEPVKDC